MTIFDFNDDLKNNLAGLWYRKRTWGDTTRTDVQVGVLWWLVLIVGFLAALTS